jgi:hypothetical protein
LRRSVSLDIRGLPASARHGATQPEGEMRGVGATVRSPVNRLPTPLRRAPSAAVALFLVLAGASCFGDLLHRAAPGVAYVFESPLSDTMLNVGDTTKALVCRLTVNGRPVECVLGIAASGTQGIFTTSAGRLVMRGVGTATVEMRPLNVFLPADTIVRTAIIRSVVPMVRWADGRSTDTLAVGAMKLLLALPTTRSGAPIAGAPIRWVQDSGLAAAHLVPRLEGWIQADSVGVAVFRVVSDTASSVPRRVVVVPQPLGTVGGGSGGPAVSRARR